MENAGRAAPASRTPGAGLPAPWQVAGLYARHAGGIVGGINPDLPSDPVTYCGSQNWVTLVERVVLNALRAS